VVELHGEIACDVGWTMMRYALSNRQMKELSNGKLLRITLPIPEQPAADWIAWSRQSLEVAPQYVVRARPADVWCYRAGDQQSPVEFQIGKIILDDVEPPMGAIVYCVAVVIVELCAREEPRGKFPAQWPAKISQEA
jgi:hypothetical protein